MNVSQQKIDELNAIITVKVEPSDYQENVDKVLKDYRKKANMPGFRAGLVPVSMIKKMYGKHVLAEELNKILSNSLNSYIVENKIEVLGSPLASDSQKDLDLNGTEFEFHYELGIAPKFEVEVSDKEKFNQYIIKADKKLLDKYTDDIRKAYGKLSEGDIVTEKDILTVNFVELDSNGNPKEGGINHKSSVAIDTIDNKDVQKLFLGKKKEDTLTLDPAKISKGDVDLAAMLGISKDLLPSISNNFKLTIEAIRKMEPAELNQDFFDKFFGKDVVKGLDEFNAKITSEIEKVLAVESDRKLRKDINDLLIEKAKLTLPTEFLKRWLISVNEKPITMEDVNKEFDHYSESIKLQLIENKIIKKYDVKVEESEAKEKANELIRNQMAQYGMTDLKDEDIEKYAETLLQQEQEAKNIYQQLYDDKLLSLFKQNFKLKEKEVTYDEFVDLLKNKNENILQRLNRSLFKR